MSNFATQYRLRTSFTSTFAPTDKRLQLICTSYVNNAGQTIDLSTGDNARSFKYWDNNTVGNNSGTDVPILRYADILLTRAEALNELNGPTEEAFGLINHLDGVDQYLAHLEELCVDHLCPGTLVDDFGQFREGQSLMCLHQSQRFVRVQGDGAGEGVAASMCLLATTAVLSIRCAVVA